MAGSAVLLHNATPDTVLPGRTKQRRRSTANGQTRVMRNQNTIITLKSNYLLNSACIYTILQKYI